MRYVQSFCVHRQCCYLPLYTATRPVQAPAIQRGYVVGKAQVPPAAEQEPGGAIVVALAAFAVLGMRPGVPAASLLDDPVGRVQEPDDPADRERDVAVDMALAGLLSALPECAYRVRSSCNKWYGQR